eukprot:1258816-Pyramimonas_sp.AAC.1
MKEGQRWVRNGRAAPADLKPPKGARLQDWSGPRGGSRGPRDGPSARRAEARAVKADVLTARALEPPGAP